MVYINIDSIEEELVEIKIGTSVFKINVVEKDYIKKYNLMLGYGVIRHFKEPFPFKDWIPFIEFQEETYTFIRGEIRVSLFELAKEIIEVMLVYFYFQDITFKRNTIFAVNSFLENAWGSEIVFTTDTVGTHIRKQFREKFEVKWESGCLLINQI